jgi:cobyric acid synthase
MLEECYGVPVLGVLPYLTDWRGDEEDSLGIDTIAEKPGADLRIAAIRLPYISNFTDLHALASEPDVSVAWAHTPRDLEGADAVIVPGSKSTVDDLGWLRSSGLAEKIREAAYEGVPVVGICGGYQMLGRRIEDRLGVEGTSVEGIGLLDAHTVFEPRKRTVRASGALTGCALGTAGTAAAGYEIHMGRTALGPDAQPLMVLEAADGTYEDGAASTSLPVCGTYLHGLFDEPELRRGWLDSLRARRGLAPLPPDAVLAEDPLDRLADMLETHLDVDSIAQTCGIGPSA